MHSREFLRRYEHMPQVKKAELIEGVVYMGDTTNVLAALTQNEVPMGKQSENSVVKEDPFTTGK